MSDTVNLYQVDEHPLSIVPGERYRDWMKRNGHSIRCTPLSAANRFGWDVVIDEDLTVEWNGGSLPDDLKILSAHSLGIKESHFGMGTVTLNVGYTWHSTMNTQMMIMPIPNVLDAEFVPLSAVVETDILPYPWFLTIRFLNVGVTTIKAGSRVARVMPVNTGALEKTKISIVDEPNEFRNWRNAFHNERNAVDAAERKGPYPNWTKRYHGMSRFKNMRAPAVSIETSRSTVDERLSALDILVLDDFLDPEECAFLIAKWHASEKHSGENMMWEGRVVVPDDWGSAEARLGDALLEKIQAFFERPLHAHDRHLVRWQPGHSMPSHRDRDDPDDGLDHREIVAIAYLNDDYSGGHTILPTHELELAPCAGSVVVFRGGSLLHGVSEVSGADRFTAIQWFSFQSDTNCDD